MTFNSIFDALADKNAAANMKARAELMRQIVYYVKARGWTQIEVAHRCDVAPQRISDLMNGRLSKFSLDALVNIGSALGTVSIEFRG